jgi:hypothetical protein
LQEATIFKKTFALQGAKEIGFIRERFQIETNAGCISTYGAARMSLPECGDLKNIRFMPLTIQLKITSTEVSYGYLFAEESLFYPFSSHFYAVC